MPTANPRINVTLAPSLDALVARMAKLQRVSKSQVLRELLEAAEPALQRAVLLMEAASSARREVLGGLAASMEKAQDQVEAILSDRLAAVDAATVDLVSIAEAVKERRPARRRFGDAPAGGPARGKRGGTGAAGGESTPVPVTRGSGASNPRSGGASKGVKRG